MKSEVFPQVSLSPELFGALSATELRFILRPRVGVLGLGRGARAAYRIRLIFFSFGFMPAAMRRQVSRATECFVALGAAVLNAHDARALVVRQSERVRVSLFTQLADELTQLSARTLLRVFHRIFLNA